MINEISDVKNGIWSTVALEYLVRRNIIFIYLLRKRVALGAQLSPL